MISQYQGSLVAPDNISRADSITKAFRAKLDRDFITRKRPADYAEGLNISVAYLNECVRSATGLSVTHHIQQRVILEAKRLLYHSDNSVKEIATALGYDDYPYFSRLFTKVTGMTALAFRSRNHD
jgi:AraC-like DNA-binding protein